MNSLLSKPGRPYAIKVKCENTKNNTITQYIYKARKLIADVRSRYEDKRRDNYTVLKTDVEKFVHNEIALIRMALDDIQNMTCPEEKAKEEVVDPDLADPKDDIKS